MVRFAARSAPAHRDAETIVEAAKSVSSSAKIREVALRIRDETRSRTPPRRYRSIAIRSHHSPLQVAAPRGPTTPRRHRPDRSHSGHHLPARGNDRDRHESGARLHRRLHLRVDPGLIRKLHRFRSCPHRLAPTDAARITPAVPVCNGRPGKPLDTAPRYRSRSGERRVRTISRNGDHRRGDGGRSRCASGSPASHPADTFGNRSGSTFARTCVGYLRCGSSRGDAASPRRPRRAPRGTRTIETLEVRSQQMRRGHRVARWERDSYPVLVHGLQVPALAVLPPISLRTGASNSLDDKSSGYCRMLRANALPAHRDRSHTTPSHVPRRRIR